jgi:hypothetical protein
MLRPNPKVTDDTFSIVFDLARCLKEKLNDNSLYTYLVNKAATHPSRPDWVVDGFQSSIEALTNPLTQQVYLQVMLSKLGQGKGNKKKMKKSSTQQS